MSYVNYHFISNFLISRILPGKEFFTWCLNNQIIVSKISSDGIIPYFYKHLILKIMNKSLLFFLLLVIIMPINLSAQMNKIKKDVKGKWLFEAPYAPEGYKSGIIEVTLTDNKYSTIIVFNGKENKFAGEKVKFENDSLSFNVFIDNQVVVVRLMISEETKMTGKVVYSEGEVPLSLTLEKKKE
jgi:hypothetical protein